MIEGLFIGVVTIGTVFIGSQIFEDIKLSHSSVRYGKVMGSYNIAKNLKILNKEDNYTDTLLLFYNKRTNEFWSEVSSEDPKNMTLDDDVVCENYWNFVMDGEEVTEEQFDYIRKLFINKYSDKNECKCAEEAVKGNNNKCVVIYR